MPSAYLDGLKMLGRRELSETQVRQRLARKEYPQDEIDAAIGRLREELGAETQTIATGGLSEHIVPYCDSIDEIDPLLTLTGLRLLHERNL